MLAENLSCMTIDTNATQYDEYEWCSRACTMHGIRTQMENITLRSRGKFAFAFVNLCRKGTTELRNRDTFGITCLDVTEIDEFTVHT